KPALFSGSRIGTTAQDWLFQMRQYLDLTIVEPHQQVPFASSFLRDNAATWWRSHIMAADAGSIERITTWAQFHSAVLVEFQPINIVESARDRLDALYQTSSVQEYVRKFREVTMLIPDLSGGEALHKFVSGLKPLTKREVKTRFPKSLDEAVRIADMVD